jgi:polyhydroxybutyrate depolymerase
MRTALGRWGDLNGCRRPIPQRTLDNGVLEQGYTGCRGGADVVARITPGAGHVWTADNDAMWDFFAAHRR